MDDVFWSHVSELKRTLVATTIQYARENRLGAFDESGLKQMSADLDDVAIELLTLGVGYFPESVAFDVEEKCVIAA